MTMTNSSSKLRLLVTGGAGFLGSNLIHGLNARGITDITIVDRLGSGSKWRNLVGLRFSHYMEVDEYVKWLDSAAGKARTDDIIIHLGACSSTREADASYLMANNFDFSRRLMDYAVANGIRFVYASSAATYGAGPQDDSLSPSVLRPLNPYALSKNMVDLFVEQNGFAPLVAGLKYFNIFGPNSRHKGVMTDFVAKTYDQIKTAGYATLYDTHTHGVKDQRDFLYVKDAVDMTLWFALDAQGQKANGLFNIGSGVPASWTEVARQVCVAYLAATGEVMNWFAPGDSIKYIEMPRTMRPQYQYYTCADISKLRAAGYTAPITPLSDAIKDYVTQYLVPDKRRGEVTS